MPSPLPPVLDVTCGSRMIHFDPDCPDVLFCDNRECDGEAIWKGGSHGKPSTRHLNVHPDRIVDFTRMPFPDESFHLVVLSPFMGIGSEGYVAIRHGRRFVGCELKPSYFRVACENLRDAERTIIGREDTLFAL